MPFGPKLKVENFFDRPKIVAALEKGKRRAFLRAGAAQRRIMIRIFPRRKSRKRSGKSQPGGIPYVWRSSRDDLALQQVFFVYDEIRDQVIVGPRGIRAIYSRPVPQLLNEGGQATITRRKVVPKWAGYRRRAGVQVLGESERVTGRYSARPFVGPSLNAFKSRYPDLWRGVVGG